MIKALIGKVFAKAGYRIVKKETKEDIAFSHQKKLLGDSSKKVIFDVGAYVGETAIRYNRLFAGACDIYSFEPFRQSYNKLKSNVQGYPNIIPVNAALSNTNGTTAFQSNKFAATNSLLLTSEKASETWGSDMMETTAEIQVPVRTLDDFAKQNQIESIDILKMDTQGSEYMVLEGASDCLSRNIIKLIYTEIITVPSYKDQKSLDETLKIFRECGFELFNLYPAIDSNKQLRYMDAIFIKKDLKC